MNLLIDLNSQGKIIIIVTHDENIALKCRRIIKIEDGTIIRDYNNLSLCNVTSND